MTRVKLGRARVSPCRSRFASWHEFVVVVASVAVFQMGCATSRDTKLEDWLPEGVPHSDRPFLEESEAFQFVIVSDRTGGHRSGVFEDAMEQVNRLRPSFVLSVGDLIEGYSEDPEKV